MLRPLLFLVYVIVTSQLRLRHVEPTDDDLYVAKIASLDEAELRKFVNRQGYDVIRKLQSFDDVYLLRRLIRRKRDVDADVVEAVFTDQRMEWTERLNSFRRFKRKDVISKSLPEHVWKLKPSMNIDEAWRSGFNASSVTVVVLDDGVDHSHAELQHAFSPQVSYDFTMLAADPTPEKTAGNEHGTQCAGLIAMVGESCGLGVGYGARLGAVRILGRNLLNDAVEGDSLAFKSQEVDVYSVSWGPRDDGKTVAAPQRLAQQALEDGAKKGRQGKGNIFVWASGNGGEVADNCALDGYASNAFTVTVGVVGSDGAPAAFAESCSAVLAAVAGGDSTIQTTGFDSTCSSLSGSSASAAIASGIIALSIQAKSRPFPSYFPSQLLAFSDWNLEFSEKLSQRDVQHLIVQSAATSDLNVDWQQNAAGHLFNSHVGFGLLDAHRLVQNALQWKTVDEERVCTVASSESIEFSEKIELTIPFQGCGNSNPLVNFVERVVLVADVVHKRRGQLKIALRSPQGTWSELLQPRAFDDSPEGLTGWSFVSVQFWSENPQGDWVLSVSQTSEPSQPGELKNVKFVVRGTTEDPLLRNRFLRRGVE